MAKKDLFGDEETNQNQMSEFEAMLAGVSETKRVSTGTSLRGEILTIGKDEAFVSTGTPVDGALPLRELLDDKGQLKYKVGDTVDVKVVRVRQDEILLRLAGSTSSGDDLDSLEDAFDMELPVEGTVLEAVKGGFRVKVQGKMTFCPVSQIDNRFVTETAEYIGKKFDFIVTQFDKGGRNIVVSRKKILSLKKAESEGEFLAQQKQGDILQGTVRRIEKYGAFVQLESGVEGLIPISELAWGRVNDPSEIVHVGQAVTVALVRAVEDGDRLKVSLSLKQAGGEGDPWMQVTTKFPVGTVAEGLIERKEPYGLFVKLAPGITGLMPRGKWRDHMDSKTYENMKKGETVKVQVDEILFEEHKITLAPPGEAADMSWQTHSGGQRSAGLGFGTLGDLLKGVKTTK
jgi:small subunit ribosomal protein S1